MTIVAILIAGILVGLLAGYIMHQKILGILGFLMVGLAGSFIGGFFFGHHLSITTSIFTNVLITSTIGALICILAIGLFKSTEVRTGRV
jgi:uncharacterized membrane protein YeaQ/YmgE (transglycosylase-associated protein family)